MRISLVRVFSIALYLMNIVNFITVLNNSGKSGYSCLIPHFRNNFVLSVLTIKYNVGYSLGNYIIDNWVGDGIIIQEIK